MMMNTKHRRIVFGILVCIVLLCYHFRRDIFNLPMGEGYVIRSRVYEDGFGMSKGQTILLPYAPYLECSVRKRLDRLFWTEVSLDTLHRYKGGYSIRYYRETKYLNHRFKVGDEYDPVFCSWDNTMDWRNHFEDRLAEISFDLREDGTCFYTLTTFSTGYGIRFFVDIPARTTTYEEFSSIEEAYHSKRRKFGLE